MSISRSVGSSEQSSVDARTSGCRDAQHLAQAPDDARFNSAMDSSGGRRSLEHGNGPLEIRRPAYGGEGLQMLVPPAGVLSMATSLISGVAVAHRDRQPLQPWAVRMRLRFCHSFFCIERCPGSRTCRPSASCRSSRARAGTGLMDRNDHAAAERGPGQACRRAGQTARFASARPAGAGIGTRSSTLNVSIIL